MGWVDRSGGVVGEWRRGVENGGWMEGRVRWGRGRGG